MTNQRASDAVAEIVSRKNAILRHMFIPQALAGVCLVILGYRLGHDHFRLVTSGTRATGTVVAFKEQRIGRRDGVHTPRLAFMPILEFHTKNRLYRFQDWLGSSSQAGIGMTAPVLYDADDPADAMIDRRFANWLPWAPTFLVGVFLCIVAVRGWAAARYP